MNRYQFEENAVVSGNIAADGMVLLENHEELLPVAAGTRIAVFGAGQMDYSMCGLGSGSVLTAYRIDFVQGLLEAEEEGKVIIDREVLASYRTSLSAGQTDVATLAETAGNSSPANSGKTSALTAESVESIAAAAERNDVALFIVSRNAGEGGDRRDVPGDYYLSESEEALLDKLIASGFEKIAVIVNSGGLIDLSWFKRSPKLKALIMAWQPGMHGGRALAKILCGEINPSGRLTDTIAVRYADYPASGVFHDHDFEMVYEEDIFVGYRYFETVPGAEEKVLYPFGYGLSYTTFETAVKSFECDGKIVRCTAAVTNTGSRPGREVVQLYSSHSGGRMEYPARELRAFAKTGMIAPGESQCVNLEFDFSSLAAFDDSGISGAPVGSFVLEKGVYSFHAGDNVRHTELAGEYELGETVVPASPGLLLQRGLNRRLHADGTFSSMPIARPFSDERLPYEEERSKPETCIMLKDVADGKSSLDEFVRQLSRRELLHLAHGQDAFTTGATGGIGDLRRYGVPNPQTADGPAGVRQLVPSTGFPCGTLLACSWDKDLQYLMGETFGREAAAFKVDILLAPALNIHRAVLCGRNFEYFSEDPLVSGRTAASIVNGIQSQNVGATVKHFAANNCENRRKFTDSVISERALREIYLKGFEIAVKEGAPWCVMSGYNPINGRKCSCNYNLLTRILRNEWGFDGLVMTDWVTHAHLWEEILAGNNVKMPGREFDMYKQNEYMDHDFRFLPRQVLERNAMQILQVIMKTSSFRNGEFARTFKLNSDDGLRLFASEMSSVMVGSSNISPCLDVTGGDCHCHLITIFHGNYSQKLTFTLDAETAGRYSVSFRLAADRPGSSFELYLGDEFKGSMTINPTSPRRCKAAEQADPGSKQLQSWQTQGSIELDIPAGMHDLRLVINADVHNATGVNLNYIDLTPVK